MCRHEVSFHMLLPLVPDQVAHRNCRASRSKSLESPSAKWQFAGLYPRWRKVGVRICFTIWPMIGIPPWSPLLSSDASSSPLQGVRAMGFKVNPVSSRFISKMLDSLEKNLFQPRHLCTMKMGLAVAMIESRNNVVRPETFASRVHRLGCLAPTCQSRCNTGIAAC